MFGGNTSCGKERPEGGLRAVRMYQIVNAHLLDCGGTGAANN